MQCGVVTGDSVVVVFLGAFDDDLRHLGNLAHELVTADFAAFHLRQFVLPFAGQFWLGQFVHAQTVQQGH